MIKNIVKSLFAYYFPEDYKKIYQPSTSTIQPPQSYGRIERKDVAKLFSKYGFNYDLSDDFFNTTTQTEASTFVSRTKVQDREWKLNDHDCDNFSFALLGYWSHGFLSFPFGYARSATHAFNIMVDNKGVLWICEPQSNTWWKYDDNTESKYKITFVLM